MNRMRCGCLTPKLARHGGRVSGLAVLLLCALCVSVVQCEAQYTADYQTNIISGVTSNWAGDYFVGSNTFADVLLIQNSGVLSNGYGYLGYEVSSSNNSVLVTGTGSVWSNGSDLYVGYSGAGNSLVISNGGTGGQQATATWATTPAAATTACWSPAPARSGTTATPVRRLLWRGQQPGDQQWRPGGQQPTATWATTPAAATTACWSPAPARSGATAATCTSATLAAATVW